MGTISRWLLASIIVFATAAPGCADSEPTAESTTEAVTTPAPRTEWGSYPAETSLDEKEVVEAYVDAISRGDGRTFCTVVAPWISGRLDIAGTDPDASTRRPLRCPLLVATLRYARWENHERTLRGASISEFGDVEERAPDLVSVPVTIALRFDEERRSEYEEPLEDVVWLTKDSGAWRVAKLSRVAGFAALTSESETDPLSSPDVAGERRKFAADVATAQRLRAAREASYRIVVPTASCPDVKTYPDEKGDVVDYQHPAPPTPTPQLPAADIRAVHVHASSRALCAVFELQGQVRTETTFDFAIESPNVDWGRAGFSQGFEVELRADGRARVTSGLNDERRPVAVPAKVGRAGNRFMLVVDERSFRTGRPFPGSVATSRPLRRFNLRADVTVRLSDERLLHDDLGPGPPEGVLRYRYP